MATLGQKLTAPESGWKRYDDMDPLIQYRGSGWGTVTNDPNTYGKTSHYMTLSATTTNSIRFCFYGSKLRLIDLYYSNRVNNVNVNIDGENYSYNPCNTQNQYQVIVFEKIDLPLTIHEVIISTKSASNVFSLDAIDIDDTGYLTAYSLKYLFQDGEEIKRFYAGGNTNIALNKTYTKNFPDSTYPDNPSKTKFTDGLTTQGSAWANCIGMNNLTVGSIMTGEIVIDLEEIKYVDQATFYSADGNTAYAANTVEIQLSLDNSVFTSVGSAGTIGVCNPVLVVNFSSQKARFVKFIFQKKNVGYGYDWFMITEGRVREGSSLWETIGASPATKSYFDQYGMTSLSSITQEVIDQLTSPTPELLVWTDEESATEDAIPALISNTSGSPVQITRSGAADANYEAWKAFNKTTVDSYDAWAPGAATGWVQVDFAANVKIVEYSVTSRNDTQSWGINGPKSWQLLGSNSGLFAGEEVVVDTQLDQIGWGNKEKRTYAVPSPQVFQFYRLNVTASNASAFSIGELELRKEMPLDKNLNLTAVPLPQIVYPVGDLEIGEIESLKIDAGFGGNAVTKMTTSTTDGVTVGANQIAGSGYEAWRAFDRDLTTHWQGGSSNATLNVFFPETKLIAGYAITTANQAQATPKTFKLEGSFDKANWALLDSQTVTDWNLGERREFSLSSLASYPYYQFTAMTMTGGSYSCQIRELELLEPNSDLKIIASGDGGSHWNTFDGSAWQTIDPLGKESIYEGHSGNVIPTMTSDSSPGGIASASGVNGSNYAWKAFDGIKNPSSPNYEGWQVNASSGWLAYEFQGPKVIQKYTLTCGAWADGKSQAPRDWTFEGWTGSSWVVLDTKTGITWIDGETKEFTFDNSQSFQKYRVNISSNIGSSYTYLAELEMMEGIIKDSVSIVKTQGMTPTTLNAITKDQWAALATNGKIRLAYYLEQSSSSDVCYVDALNLRGLDVATSTPSLDQVSINLDELTIEGRLKDLEFINAINLAKLNFKSNALVNATHYKLNDFVVDTFDDNSVDSATATYDNTLKGFKAIGNVTMPVEVMPSTRKQIWLTYEGTTDVTFDYSLDGGSTWSSIPANTLTDVSGKTGLNLRIKANLPAAGSQLLSLAYGWV